MVHGPSRLPSGLESCRGAILLLGIAICVPSFVIAQETTTATESELAELSYPGKTLRDGLRNLADQRQHEIVIDPKSVDAQVGLVDAYTMLWCFGFTPRDEVLPKMRVAAEQAVQLDDQDAGARTALGIVKLSHWDWAGAEKELSSAVDLDPNRAQSRHWYALYLASRGKHAEAMEQSNQAVKLDPSVGMQVGKGSILYFGHDWEGLINQMQQTVKLDPNFAPAYDWLGMGYAQEKKFAESIATYKRGVVLSGGLAEILAGLGHAYAVAGEAEKARGVLANLNQFDERWYVPPVQIAYVHVGLGEYDEAMQLLNRAYREHSWELVFLQVEPWFDPIRSDPRFIALTKKMNFPE